MSLEFEKCKESPAGEKCVAMTVRQLFEIRCDMHFRVKPFSRVTREFPPWQVHSFLGTAGIAVSERVGIPYAEDEKARSPKQVPDRVQTGVRVLIVRNFDIRAPCVAEHGGSGTEANDRVWTVVDLAERGDQVRALRDAGTVITAQIANGGGSFVGTTLPARLHMAPSGARG